jgi:dTDP-4-amino-4,6-dideoxygalactose transaminase
MAQQRIWLSPPHMGGNEQKYIQQAFDSNWIAPQGPNLNILEQNLESYLGSGYVAVLNSGTAAIHLGLLLLGVKFGDEVLCQSLTFSASANPILYIGATPVFIDSERDTWNLCPIALEMAINDRIAKGRKPKAIIAVHLYGTPFKIASIKAISKKYDIPILEDSAEALGSSYKRRKCGTFGDIAVLSFNGNKIITTSGGGAVITKTKAQRDKAVFYASNAKDEAPHYEHSEIGYNYRMSNICAGVGRGQMEVLDHHVSLRRANHDFYVDLFKEIDSVTVFCAPDNDYFTNYWLTVILITPVAPQGVDSEKLRLAFDKANIESRPVWKPMHLQTIFSNYSYYGGTVAEDLFEKGLCLPSGSNLTVFEKERIKQVVFSVFKEV